MRHRARIGLTLFGLAVAAPALVWADPPVSSTGTPNSTSPARAASSPTHKHRWKLFGPNDLCAECQRAKVKARDGVDVPPPPATPNPALIVSRGAAPAPAMIVSRGAAPAAVGECKECEAQAGQFAVASADGAPGRAVAGGEIVPGYAIVGGGIPVTEPMPIGMVSARPTGPMPAMGPGMGMGMNMGPQGQGRGRTAGRRGPAQADPSVMPSAFAPDTIASPPSGRPHILRHVFGLDAIGRQSAEERERRKRETHAMQSYGAANQQVYDVPASAVFDKGGR